MIIIVHRFVRETLLLTCTYQYYIVLFLLFFSTKHSRWVFAVFPSLRSRDKNDGGAKTVSLCPRRRRRCTSLRASLSHRKYYVLRPRARLPLCISCAPSFAVVAWPPSTHDNDVGSCVFVIFLIVIVIVTDLVGASKTL